MSQLVHMSATQHAGLGALDLNSIISQSFASFNNFINSKYAKDAAKFTGGGILPGASTLTQQQQLALLASGNAPGSQVASGIGASFNSLAAQFGISPTTMMILLLGGGYLLLKEPPRSRR